MDLSSDCEDDVVPSIREPSSTPTEQTRDSTPSLSTSEDTSDAETDVTDWSQDESNAQQVSSEPFGGPSIFLEADGPRRRSRSPLFLPSPQPSPCPRKIADFAAPIDVPPFQISLESVLGSDDSRTSGPVTRFLNSLRRPCGHLYNAFYQAGIRTAEDIHALSSMPADWEVIHRELSKGGVTLMEWLYIKAGLESAYRKFAGGILTPLKFEWEG